MACGLITMRQCVAYIHDSSMTFIFDLKVKLPGFFILHVQPVTSPCFDIGLWSLAHGSITMGQCVAYIHDPTTTLTFELNINLIWFLTVLRVWATAFLIKICPLSVVIVVVVVVVNFSHFDLSTKLGTKHPWVKGIQVCSNEGPRPIPRRDNYEIAKIHWSI